LSIVVNELIVRILFRGVAGMDGAVLAFVLIGLMIGAAIGWLVGCRASAGAKQTIATLRAYVDEVVKERDINRSAAGELAALKAAQTERERAFEERMTEIR
jgi:hypothetical protein